MADAVPLPQGRPAGSGEASHGQDPSPRELLAERLRRGRPSDPHDGLAAAGAGSEALTFAPLSFAQERMWFLERLLPGTSVHHIARAFDLEGPLDKAALGGAWTALVERHAALATGFHEEGGEALQARAALPRPALPVIDLAGLGERAAGVAARIERPFARRPFVLDRAPLWRVCLLVTAPGRASLLFAVHHLIFDGLSFQLLAAEWLRSYRELARGAEVSRTSPATTYFAFARWQRERLQGARLERLLAWWRRELAGYPGALDLPLDRPRPAQASGRGARLSHRLSRASAGAVESLASRLEVTSFAVYLAAFRALLGRLTGQADVGVGVPVGGRERRELEEVIGCFADTLVLRLPIAADPPVDELIRGVHRTLLGALTFQELPFERLVAELAPARNLATAPLVQALFVQQADPLAGVEVPGLGLSVRELETGGSGVDLLVEVSPHADALVVRAGYSTDLFDATTIGRWLAGFEATLASFASSSGGVRLSELAWLSPAERHQVRNEWGDGGPSRLASQGSAWELVRRALEGRPESVVWVVGEEHVSARWLLSEAAALARELAGRGVGVEDRVGICLDRGPELLPALLGIWAAGAAYVPLDPAYPEERLAFMLEDAAATVLVTRRSLLPRSLAGRGLPPVLALDELPRGESAPCVARPAPAGALAYVLYTSGSTGRPKGVAIEQRSVAALLDWAGEAFSRRELSAVLAVTSICFDLSVFELFAPLVHGGRAVLAANALELGSLPAAGAVTLVNSVPSAMAELVRMGGLPASVATVNLAGEPLPRSLVEEVYAAGSVERVLNLYGPSEDTTYSTFTFVRRDERRAPAIGRPLVGTQAHVLDAHLRPLPVGVAGELLLGGAGLARGYLGRPGLTAERFVPHPFGGPGAPGLGARLYRTGDLVRFLADGRLDFLGRIDQQVKVRGFRIELGEVEAALASAPGVGEAVAVAQGSQGDADRRLVAFYASTTGTGGPGLDPESLRSWMGERLPAYMVPSVFVELPALPRTPNGKVDRKALPKAGMGAAAAGAPPHGFVEELLAAVWAGVLGLPVATLGREDDFFRLGGHSLLAMRLVARLRAECGVDLPLAAVFERPTLGAMGAEVERARGRASGAGSAPAAVPPLVPADATAALPLSFAQERLWLLARLDPEGTVHNLPMVLSLRGRLSPRALFAALAQIVRRHAVLRTTYGMEDGRPVQRIAPAAVLAVPVLDLSSLAKEDRGVAAERLSSLAARHRFDLARGPVLRAWLLRLAGDEHRLLANVHHVAADGWSLGVLRGELVQLLAADGGVESTLPELAVQYADFAVWQRSWITGEVLSRLLDTARARLAGAPPSLDLPADRPRPAVLTHRGGDVRRLLPPELAGRLRSLAERSGATLFMVLLAALAAVLSRWSGERDCVIGAPLAERPHPRLEGLIGCFLNTLALRVRLAGTSSFAELLARVRQEALAAFAERDLPFERLLEELDPPRDLSRTPVFQVFLNVLNFPMQAAGLPGLALELGGGGEPEAKFDLTLYASESEAGIALRLVYAADLFDPPRMAELLSQLAGFLGQAAEAPERPWQELSLVTEEARAVLPDPAAPLAESWPGPVDELFERQAAERPDAVALRDPQGTWSYGRLARASHGLARRLTGAGVGREDRVGILAHRDASLAAAILAVLAAGAAFFVLDPTYPARRLASFVARARPRALLLLEAAGELPPEVVTAMGPAAPWVLQVPASLDAADWPGSEDARPPAEKVGPGSPAVIGFTSGSAGEPKGVLGAHGSLTAFLPFWRRRFGLGPGDRFTVLSGLAHDPLQRDLLFPLALGAAAVFPEPERIGEPGYLAAWVAAEAVTVANLTPAMAQLVTTPAPGRDLPLAPALTWAFLVGEALRRSDVHRLRRLAPRLAVVNLYGSTETQRSVGYRVVSAGDEAGHEVLPLGSGMGGCQLLVLTGDRDGEARVWQASASWVK